MADEKTIEHFATARDFHDWLLVHHERQHGIWLKLAKKGSTVPTPTYDEAVDVALTFGWIDSQKRALDADVSLLAFTPRRSRSPWSMRNRLKAEASIAEGRMQPSGLAEVERARADGRWDKAYEGQSTAQVPADFLEALAANPAAAAFYETLNGANRFAVYYRLHEAKKPETRARRIAKFVDMFARGEVIH